MFTEGLYLFSGVTYMSEGGGQFHTAWGQLKMIRSREPVSKSFNSSGVTYSFILEFLSWFMFKIFCASLIKYWTWVKENNDQVFQVVMVKKYLPPKSLNFSLRFGRSVLDPTTCRSSCSITRFNVITATCVWVEVITSLINTFRWPYRTTCSALSVDTVIISQNVKDKSQNNLSQVCRLSIFSHYIE